MSLVHTSKLMLKSKAVLTALLFLAIAGAGAAGENPAKADYKAFLATHPAGVMTTVEGGQPRTRVFQYLWSEGDKAYFSTGNYKDIFKQIQANNLVSFCVYDASANIVLSLDGPATFIDDPALKKKALDENAGIRSIYKSPDNPKFALFYVEPTEIYTYSFSGGKEYIKGAAKND